MPRTKAKAPNAGASSSKAKSSKKSASSKSVILDPLVEAERSQYVFFWKPEDSEGIYSQWWADHPFTGTVPSTAGSPETIFTYNTAEHYMMAHKARLFGDLEVEAQILGNGDPSDAPDAREVKALGRLVKNFVEATWNANRLRIVEEGNMLKFTQHEELRKQLLATGERQLVEASPMDRIWGVGFGERNAPYNKGRWGLNLLGIALMNVRKRLREQDEAERQEESASTPQDS